MMKYGVHCMYGAHGHRRRVKRTVLSLRGARDQVKHTISLGKVRSITVTHGRRTLFWWVRGTGIPFHNNKFLEES